MPTLPPWLRLRCPDDGGPLQVEPGRITCPNGHAFPVRDGVPYLFPADRHPPGPEYVEWIADYERRPFSARQRAKTSRLLEEFLGFARPELPVLDVGCGRGEKTAAFPTGEYVGVDPLDPLAAGLVERLSFPFVCGVGERLPFADEQFGGVILWGVLDHVPSNEAVYRECVRVLRPGGRLCVLNRVLAQRRRSFGEMALWALRKIATLDLQGLIAVVGYSLFDPRTHRFSRFQTLDELSDGLNPLFVSVDVRLTDDGHVALIRATR